MSVSTLFIVKIIAVPLDSIVHIRMGYDLARPHLKYVVGVDLSKLLQWSPSDNANALRKIKKDSIKMLLQLHELCERQKGMVFGSLPCFCLPESDVLEFQRMYFNNNQSPSIIAQAFQDILKFLQSSTTMMTMDNDMKSVVTTTPPPPDQLKSNVIDDQVVVQTCDTLIIPSTTDNSTPPPPPQLGHYNIPYNHLPILPWNEFQSPHSFCTDDELDLVEQQTVEPTTSSAVILEFKSHSNECKLQQQQQHNIQCQTNMLSLWVDGLFV